MNATKNAVELLLIEDSPNDAELILRALKKNNLGNSIAHLKDGEEALEYIFAKGRYANRKIEDRPKMILLDLKMPKVNGLEVLKAIKSDERTSAIPIIIMTSSKEDSDIAESYKLGVNSYVVKPVNFENFSKAAAEVGYYWLLINQIKNNA
jgi:two-component system response regulator